MTACTRCFPFLFAVLIVCAVFVPARAAVTNEDCLGCHDTIKGVSHGGMGCTDCHSTITDLPHPDKLPKPVCAACHGQEAGRYDKDVHKSKGLGCAQCHNAHNPAKEKKECITCHAKVKHANLPARGRHLGSVACVACHGKPDKTRLVVQLTVKAGEEPAASDIDVDGNGVVDRAEWERFEQMLRGPLKGAAFEKNYEVSGGMHTIEAEPPQCGRCHAAGGYFEDATLRVVDSKSYELKMEPHIFTRSLPSFQEFSQTVHGRNGVTCTQCHGAEKKTAEGWSIDSSVCAMCHEDVTKTYSLSAHGKLGAAQCLDCHNPHRIQSYKEHTAKERVAICARCHTNYIERHAWLPNTTLHFSYLECATCHSPRSQKSMVYYFAQKNDGTKTPLDHDQLMALSGSDPLGFVEAGKTTAEENDAGIGALFNRLRRRDKNVVIDASILVTNVYHDYSEIPIRERQCVFCHSRQAGFYDSMFFIIPGKGSARDYIPVKDTLFASYPIGTAVDFFLLGEDKLQKGDFTTFLGLGKAGQRKELFGFKLIDLFGLVVILLALGALCVHIILRILVRR